LFLNDFFFNKMTENFNKVCLFSIFIVIFLCFWPGRFSVVPESCARDCSVSQTIANQKDCNNGPSNTNSGGCDLACVPLCEDTDFITEKLANKYENLRDECREQAGQTDPWKKYTGRLIMVDTPEETEGGICSSHITYTTEFESKFEDLCSTANKCVPISATENETGLHPGQCKCGSVGDIYKYCCSGSTPAQCSKWGSQDPFPPPEGVCLWPILISDTPCVSQCSVSISSSGVPAGVHIEVSGGSPTAGNTSFLVNATKGSSVSLTALASLPDGSVFDHWVVFGASKPQGVKTVNFSLNDSNCNNGSATAYYNVPSKYYYCKVSNKSCTQTSNLYLTKEACEASLSANLPGQTTGVCYSINDLSSCQTDCSTAGSNQTFYRCNDSNSCVSAGQYADQAACETSAGVTCYADSNCGSRCGSNYFQFYRCDGSNCKPAGRYKKTSECEAAYGAGNCYKKDSACNNECGGTTYYWCTNSNPNLCVSGATCPSRTCLTTGCPSACSSGNQYWCDANNQCQSGQSCPSQYQATCKINNCPSQCSSPPPRSVYYYCNADTNSCSSQQSTKEECEEEYGICYKQKSDCAEACEKSDPQSGGSEGEEDVSITLEVEPKCVPQNTSLDSDDPDYEGIKLNWEVSMKGNVCDQDGLSVNLPSDWSKCDEISEWQNKTPAGSGECNVAYGYLADWPNPPFSVVKSMDGLADVDPPPAVTKDYALGCKRDEYQCQWRRSCSYSCQKLCDLDCNHCVRKNPCVVADNDTEHKCCDSTCTDFQSESGLIHEGGYQFKKITLGVVQPVDFIRSLIADPLKLFRDTKETSKTRLSWGASAEDSDVNTVIKCTPSATGDDHGWQNILDSKNKSGSEELEPEKTTTYSLICRNRRATDSTCYTSKESEPPQTVEVFKKKEIKEDAPSSLRLFQNLLSFVGAKWLKR